MLALWIDSGIARERIFERLADGILNLAAHDPRVEQDSKGSAQEFSELARGQLGANCIQPLNDEIDDIVQLAGSDCGACGQGDLSG